MCGVIWFVGLYLYHVTGAQSASAGMRYKTLLILASVVSGDRRCLLEGGGSTDTFFVREDSRVGEEIGKIRVLGRPASMRCGGINKEIK